MRDTKPTTTKLDKDKKRKLIDLRKATDQSDNGIYICEYCDIRLIPYHDIEGKRLTRGKLWQCGKCGQIKDTAMDNLQHPEGLTARGDNQQIFLINARQPARPKPKQFDIDPGDDLTYKDMGMHITHTRITVGGKVVRDDREYDSTTRTM